MISAGMIPSGSSLLSSGAWMRDSASAFIFIGLVGDLEVETGEKQCPPGLTRIEPFSIYDEEQFGIRMDKEWCTGEKPFLRVLNASVATGFQDRDLALPLSRSVRGLVMEL